MQHPLPYNQRNPTHYWVGWPPRAWRLVHSRVSFPHFPVCLTDKILMLLGNAESTSSFEDCSAWSQTLKSGSWLALQKKRSSWQTWWVCFSSTLHILTTFYFLIAAERCFKRQVWRYKKLKKCCHWLDYSSWPIVGARYRPQCQVRTRLQSWAYRSAPLSGRSRLVKRWVCLTYNPTKSRLNEW